MVIGDAAQWDALFPEHLLPRIFDLASPFFPGVMPYADGRPTDWRFSVLPR